VRAFVDEHWPAVSAPATVCRVLTDPEYLARAAKEVLSADEQASLLWPTAPSSWRTARWSAADAFLVDEVAGLLDRPPSFGHVVVDEAQDLSAMQCRALARRCPTGSATILGDLAQATSPSALADWRAALSLLGREDADIVELSTGYRVPSEVLEFANLLLPTLGASVAPATSIRRAPGSLRVRHTGRLDTETAAAVRELLALEGSIGVIGTDPDLEHATRALPTGEIDVDSVDHGMAARVTLVPVTVCKGLEFDHVVVIEPAHIHDDLPRGANWLYVALTRAVTTLTVVHADDLPAALRS
jgi:DNA helicase IV